MTKTQSVWKDLITSMLSVYNYSLEKVDTYSKEFDKQGLFDPGKLKKFSHEEIFTRLEISGYKRGNLNAIFTERLLALSEYVDQKGMAHCEKILSGQDKNKISELLKPIKGIGPKVIGNYFELRELS